MENKPVISVIIPTYYSEEFLLECLDSVCNQDVDVPYEVIVVDGNSKDSTRDIIKNYKCKFLRYIFLDNNGVSLQRNVGIDNAKGDYISFVDSDDVIAKDYLSTLYKLIKNNNADIAICKYIEFTDSIPSLNEEGTIKTTDATLKELYNDTYGNGYLISCSKLYKKESIGSVRFNELIGYGEDTDFNFNIFKKYIRIVSIKKTLYFYRFHNNNVVFKLNENILTTFIGQKEQITYIIDNNLNDVLPLAIDRIYWSLNQTFLQFKKNNKNMNKNIFKEIRNLILKNKSSITIKKNKKLFFLYCPYIYSWLYLLKHKKRIIVQ